MTSGGTPELPVWVPGTNRGEDSSCEDAARSLQRGGAVLAGGSDWPVTQLPPWRQIEMATTREHDPSMLGGQVVYDGGAPE